jgi:hypothetical protein
VEQVQLGPELLREPDCIVERALGVLRKVDRHEDPTNL